MAIVNIFPMPVITITGLTSEGTVAEEKTITVSSDTPELSFIDENGEFVFESEYVAITDIQYTENSITAKVTLNSPVNSTEIHWQSTTRYKGINSPSYVIKINPAAPTPVRTAEMGIGRRVATITLSECPVLGNVPRINPTYNTVQFTTSGGVVEAAYICMTSPSVTFSSAAEGATLLDSMYSFKLINTETSVEHIIQPTAAGSGAFPNAVGYINMGFRANATQDACWLNNAGPTIVINITKLPRGNYDWQVIRKSTGNNVANPFTIVN